MAGLIHFTMGLFVGVSLTVGGNFYVKEQNQLPTGNNAQISFDIDRTMFQHSPAATYASNAKSTSSHYPSRWEWLTFGGLYDEDQDFTIAYKTCGDRVCSSHNLRSTMSGIKRFNRKNGKYKWGKDSRKISLSHANVTARDFIFKEESVLKWCTAYSSIPNETVQTQFYGWHCAPEGYLKNDAVLDCTLESLDYAGKQTIREINLNCSKEALAFEKYKSKKNKRKTGAKL